jgi:hypothetical protein
MELTTESSRVNKSYIEALQIGVRSRWARAALRRALRRQLQAVRPLEPIHWLLRTSADDAGPEAGGCGFSARGPR